MVSNVFVVGAPKAGTTSLYQYLGQHPRIFIPEVKELHYFSQPEVSDTYYPVPMVKTEEEYRGYFRDCREDQIAGDFSPSYLIHEEAAQRIREFEPEARIIVCLRDPVDRAISHYLMDQRMNLVSTPMLEILKEPGRHPRHYRAYVSMGEYTAQLRRYEEVFPSGQIRIVQFDDLVRDAEGVTRKLLEFLGLPSGGFQFETEAHNRYQVPRARWIVRAGQRGVGKMAWAVGKRVLPRRLLDRALYSRSKPSMDEERRWLAEHYVALNDTSGTISSSRS